MVAKTQKFQQNGHWFFNARLFLRASAIATFKACCKLQLWAKPLQNSPPWKLQKCYHVVANLAKTSKVFAPCFQHVVWRRGGVQTNANGAKIPPPCGQNALFSQMQVSVVATLASFVECCTKRCVGYNWFCFANFRHGFLREFLSIILFALVCLYTCNLQYIVV